MLFGLFAVVALTVVADRNAAAAATSFAALLTLGCASFLRSWFRRFTTEIVVTDRRIIYKMGWIARRTREMNITKVETVDVRQSVIGRGL
ncbi:MAG TPA: PH domain-containing protein, partial [Rhodopila sp.]